MSEFGLKIRNIEASTLFEYNNGVRDHYEFKNALFVKSLFYDFIVGDTQAQKDKVKHNNKSTRDIICLEFNYGSRSYVDEVAHLNKHIKKNENILSSLSSKLEATQMDSTQEFNIRKEIDNVKFKLNRFKELLAFADENNNNYEKHSADELRHMFYRDGVTIKYKNRNGKVYDTIHYVMLFRSTGKAKKGSCVFINEKLYDIAIDFLRMGIKLPKDNAKIVEISAYSSLIASGIINKVKIDPDSILVLKDVDESMQTSVLSIEVDERGLCTAKMRDDYEIKNTLFDGQALIDSSIFPEWADGYILLRHHFFKAAAFCTHIQSFLADYCAENGLDYETYVLRDMWGREIRAKDVRMITTENALKWLKFDVDFDYWADWVRKNDSMFGVVKTTHKSKFGDVQRMSYQMVNSLDMDTMSSVCQKTIDYVDRLKNDDEVFREYLRDNANFANDYEVLLALYEQNNDFNKSSYYKERKKYILQNYILGVKSGKLLQDAENLTIVGSPYAMLLYAASGDSSSVKNDTTFSLEDGATQCYTSRFGDGQYLAEFRSPYNSRNNLGHLHNVYSEEFEKYFDFGNLIIAINMVGTDFQDRNNGSDQDSDSIYVTNQEDIVEHARRCVRDYPTIVNNIPQSTKSYSSSPDSFASVDCELAGSQLNIGESSNLAQLAQTYSASFNDKRYDDYAAILAILAQISIDSAKRLYDCSVSDEVRRIKNLMNIKNNGYPLFWSIIRPEFGVQNPRINKELSCPMNYLYNLTFDRRRYERSIPISDFFAKQETKNPIGRRCKKIERLITKYSLNVYNTLNSKDEDSDIILLLRTDFNELVDDIKSIVPPDNYIGLMAWLIDRAFIMTPQMYSNQKKIKSTLRKNRPLLVKVLYTINPEMFLSLFSR